MALWHEDNLEAYKFIGRLAAAVKEEDPYHPVGTAIAGFTAQLAESLRLYASPVSVLGINYYGDDTPAMLAKVQAGWAAEYKLPFIVTEYGPNNNWQVAKTSWGAGIEQTSSQKVRVSAPGGLASSVRGHSNRIPIAEPLGCCRP